MGLIDISKTDEEKTYLFYKTSNEILELQVIVFNEALSHFSINVSEETSVVKRWAQNLQQTPEIYFSQLKISLLSKSLEIKEKSNVGSENIFEFDGSNLIWRQFFREKKLFGRKGKFELNMIETNNASDLMKTMMTKFVEEFACKDETISSLEKQNECLVAENKELRLISEKSVKMKEDLEKQLYKKFALLLNAKKEKLSIYRKKFIEVGGHCKSSQSTNEQRSQTATLDSSPSTSVQMATLSKGETNRLSDEEYEDDTDVDSPQEVNSDGETERDLKRKSPKWISANESNSKKTKPLSQDLFNDSLEMELQSSSSFFRKQLKRT